ncbi:hypothetical protein BDR06DRAFT_966799 [Suillus hirtellus]|nr:hypothetical protein BDR06DRAFT_966799 [Suillus hirtellus]
MPKGENGPGGFVKILTDGPSLHVCVHMDLGNRATDGPKMCDQVGLHAQGWAQLVGMLGNKGNRWAPNVRPDGPTVDFISEKANWASAYADVVLDTVTDGPSPQCLNSEKATDRPSPPWVK